MLGYPRATDRQLSSRLTELKKLGVTSVVFSGPTRIGKLDVLGKGYAGIVILARRKRKTVAIKIRRTDSARNSMRDEATMLTKANKAGVGPRLYAVSRNFLVMEFLDGKKIWDWFAELGGAGSAKKAREVIRAVLEDAYRLDNCGLDHGELSSISKHVIVGRRTTMIDFESSSTKRRVSNVTSAAQGIYIGSGISKKLGRICKMPKKAEIIAALRRYKHEPDRANFDRLLAVLKV